MRILIADDDRTSTMKLGRTLEQWEFDVVVAHDGLKAWESITGDKPPALAIVDWMMPGLDGIELCRRIRATPLRSLAVDTLIDAPVTEHRDRITELFDKYNLLALPVVDEERKLSGVITADDIISVLREK